MDNNSQHWIVMNPSANVSSTSACNDDTGSHSDRNNRWSSGRLMAPSEFPHNESHAQSPMFMADPREQSSLGPFSSRSFIPPDSSFNPSSETFQSTGYAQYDSWAPATGQSTHGHFSQQNAAISYNLSLMNEGPGRPELQRRTFHSFTSTPLVNVQVSHAPISQGTSVQRTGTPTQPPHFGLNQPRNRLDSPPATSASGRLKHGYNPSARRSFMEDAGNPNKPYAYLIRDALMSVKDHKMTLQEIYRWFEDNTNKASDPHSKGWQSSVRHNLSMNEAFTLINNSTTGTKSKNNYWTLTKNALKNGVQSTTRYRNGLPKRSLKCGHPGTQQSDIDTIEGEPSEPVLKSRRITYIPEIETARQPTATHGRISQEHLVQQQSTNDTSRHNPYYDNSRLFMPMPDTQRLASSVINTPCLSCDGSQHDSETHDHLCRLDENITRFHT